MDNNELDYYRHETTCSNTCKSNKTMSGIDSLGSSRDSSMSSLTAGSSFEEHMNRNSAPMLGHTSFERSSSEDSADVDLPRTDEVVTPETMISLQNFWRGVSQSEMLDDVLKEIMNRLQTIQQRTRSSQAVNLDGTSRRSERASRTLTRCCYALCARSIVVVTRFACLVKGLSILPILI